ncbi:MAG: Tim44/TimA family putative adaptor protein [Pseudomonadota bacterium]|nr:Tim44/TimA family putative adaptor protein [Pseudomonadota bacterium]
MTDIIFLLILVAFIGVRLYATFGKNSETKSIRIVLKPVNKIEEPLMDNVVQMAAKQKNAKKTDEQSENAADFNKEMFLKGACKVFEIVLQAFSSGDLSSVKDLVSKKVFEAFNNTLAVRKENNITSEVDFICFDKSEVKDVKFLKNSIKVVVEFVSEQVNLLRNAEGVVIEGDENFVQKITDVWTFERTLNAKNNNWVLVSTKKTA